MDVPIENRCKQRVQSIATRLKTRAALLFTEYRIMLRALVHPGVPWYTKLVCGCCVLYVASPIQLIPNFIPVIGQLDDVLFIGLSIRLLKRSVSQAVINECQKTPSSCRASTLSSATDAKSSSEPELNATPPTPSDSLSS
jgi:uncharacterized membrane protein YkvA (DUF1232 family)